MKKRLISFYLAASMLPAAGIARAAGSLDQAADSARHILGRLVAADTTNPPGNEARAVKIGAAVLKKAGIPFEIVEFAPGRQNLVARLKGSGEAKPLLLLSHIDVVGTKGQAWTSAPHAMTEKEGYLVGRGVHDDLGMGAIDLQVFVMLKQEKIPLKRDVILAWTGDEESGGAGIQYLLKNRPELLNASIALNEGSGPVLGTNGNVRFVEMQVAEKTYQDYQLVAEGPTGHSSVPLADNAIYRLSKALSRLGDYRAPVRLIPATRAYFEARAALEPPETAKAMLAIAHSSGTPPSDAVATVETNPFFSALLRTTCVATVLNAGSRVNALPARAEANINCRLLPDETPEEVRLRLMEIIADPKIEINFEKDMTHAAASPVDGPVPEAIRKIASQFWPGAPLIPCVGLGATDSRYLRPVGVAAYGANPIAITEQDDRRAHGIDERMPASSIRLGVEYMHSLVLELAAKPSAH